MSNTNMAQAMATAAKNAKAPNALEQRKQVAAAQANAQAQSAPAPVQVSALDAQALAGMVAQMQAMQEQLAALAQENQALKAAKPASQAAPKSPIACKNCTWKHDPKAGTLTIVVDLNGDILDDTGKPKVSSTGATTAVAQLSGSLPDKNGRKVGMSLNVYHKL